MQRKLIDRAENYTELIAGKCSCGEPIIKVIGSDCTMWKNGDRYHYPNDLKCYCIYSCKNCKKSIHETFKISN
jgi:hypothetical protein